MSSRLRGVSTSSGFRTSVTRVRCTVRDTVVEGEAVNRDQRNITHPGFGGVLQRGFIEGLILSHMLGTRPPQLLLPTQTVG